MSEQLVQGYSRDLVRLTCGTLFDLCRSVSLYPFPLFGLIVFHAGVAALLYPFPLCCFPFLFFSPPHPSLFTPFPIVLLIGISPSLHPLASFFPYWFPIPFPLLPTFATLLFFLSYISNLLLSFRSLPKNTHPLQPLHQTTLNTTFTMTSTYIGDTLVTVDIPNFCLGLIFIVIYLCVNLLSYLRQCFTSADNRPATIKMVQETLNQLIGHFDVKMLALQEQLNISNENYKRVEEKMDAFIQEAKEAQDPPSTLYLETIDPLLPPQAVASQRFLPSRRSKR